MFGIGFLTPFFFWTALAVGTLPIIIHLLNREKARQVLFSSLRFISGAHQVNIKRHRLKQILLMLMRILIMLILAWAFARPFFAGDVDATSKDGIRRNVVIIIDNSYSMGYDNALSKAKDEALKAVTKLKSQDTVALMYASNTTQVIKELTSEHESVKATINAQTKLTHNPTDFLRAIFAADELLKGVKVGKKKIVLISDLQNVGWENFIETDKLSYGVEIELIDLSPKQVENLAITGVIAPEIVLKENRPSRITARIANFGAKPVKGVPIRLLMDDKEMGVESIDIEANDVNDVVFDVKLTGEQTHAGYIELPDDKLKVDNRRYFVIRTLESIKVCCVDGEPGRRNYEDETFFLTKALRPSEEVVSFEVSKLTNLPLEDEMKNYDVIMLTNLPRLSASEVKWLRDFVSAGGGLIVALGDQIDPLLYAKILNGDNNPLLPGNLTAAVGDASNHEQFNVIAVVKYEHPIFTSFNDPNHGDFGAARFYRHFQTATFADADALAQYDDGQPALIEKGYGKGRVLLFTSTFDTEWTDFPQHGVFLPFIHESVKYLALRKSEKKQEYLVNEPVELSGYEGISPTTVAIFNPAEEEYRTKRNEEGSVFYEKTDAPGIYSAHTESETRYFAINVDTIESNLTPRDAEELTSSLINKDTTKLATLTPAAEIKEYHKEVENNQQFWWYMMMALLLLAVGEMFLANRI